MTNFHDIIVRCKTVFGAFYCCTMEQLQEKILMSGFGNETFRDL